MRMTSTRAACACLAPILFLWSFVAAAKPLHEAATRSEHAGFIAHWDGDGLLPPIEPPPDPGRVRDWDGLKRDTYYFVGGQVLIIGVLYAMPESISSWSDEQKEEYSLGKWLDNIRDINYDSDKWWINYILHPYWGGTYYVRARERGYNDHEAFWYSFALSALYEFGAEALFEEPAIQDLIFTPVGGYFFGHWFMDVRENIRAREASGQGLRFRDRAALVLTDPIGVASHVLDGWLGIDDGGVELAMVPFFVAERPLHLDAAASAERRAPEIVPGIQLHLTW